MNIPKQMIYCEQCKYKKLDSSTEIFCSLTNEKPTFSDDCNNFLVAPEIKLKNKPTKGSFPIDLSLRNILSVIIFLIALYRLLNRLFD